MLAYYSFRRKDAVEIQYEMGYEFTVESAYSNRGSYILNHSYFLDTSAPIITDNKNTISGTTNFNLFKWEYVTSDPVISDVKAPFLFKKQAFNDTIRILIENQEIVLLLKNRE